MAPEGGAPIDYRRGRTAKKVLNIDWAHPVWQPPADPAAAQPGRTSAVVDGPLPAAKAYAFVAGEDRRPLLVLRECDRCKGTDHALLSRTLDNEQTLLLTRWFHCIKLPTHVTGAQHPLRNLFAAPQAGERAPHLFFADSDGGNRRGLTGEQTQTELWETMFEYLERTYATDARLAIRELRILLSQLDKVDGSEQEVKSRIDRETEKNGPRSEKLKPMQAELRKLQKERDGLLAREQELRQLAFKPPAKAAAKVPAPPAGHGG